MSEKAIWEYLKTLEQGDASAMHPVGTYYNTSDSDFDPNASWGGTWVSENVVDDEIVDEGVSGIWTYRKWKSGISECWGTKTSTLSHYGTALGGNAYYEAISIPSGMFTQTPVVIYSAYVGATQHALTGTITSATTKTLAQIYAISTASGTQPVKWFISCKGTWKTYVAPATTYRWHRTA